MKSIQLLLLLFVMASCNTEDDVRFNNSYVLPEISTEGKNTFGCNVNGQVFIPKYKSIYSSHTTLTASYFRIVDADYYLTQGYYLRIRAYDMVKDRQVEIELCASADALVEGGTYWLATKGDNAMSAIYRFSTTSAFEGNSNINLYHSHEFNTTQQYTGELKIIKLDLVRKIISGTFSFNGFNLEDNATVTVTDGRFDVVYDDAVN